MEDENIAIQLNAYAAISEKIEIDDIGEEYAEAVRLAHAATNTLSQAKGKGKGKGKDKSGKGKSKGKLVRSNLTTADRKVKLTELKSKSRCLRCGAVGHWAGDAECRFRKRGFGMLMVRHLCTVQTVQKRSTSLVPLEGCFSRCLDPS